MYTLVNDGSNNGTPNICRRICFFRKLLFFLFGIILLVSVITMLYYLIYLRGCHESPMKCYKVVDLKFNEVDDEFSEYRTKYILLWSPMFSEKNWYLVDNNNQDIIDQNFFKDESCSSSNCVITSNHNLLSNVYEYDAIVFNGVVSLPQFFPFPNIRSVHQKYVYGNLESPLNTRVPLDSFQNFYNWTMSYRLDSDIVWTYNNWIDVELNAVVGPFHSPSWRNVENDFKNSTMVDVVKRKSKMIAWFSSNCKTFSRRDELAKAIQSYLPVDIYGKCGSLKCDNQDECYKILTTDYKFYLSFENSLCRDYVTEKFYSILDYDIVPVVYGGANYSKFAPPHSYIDANDFVTVKKLVEYLTYLDKHPEEYVKYFWWKQYYRLHRRPDRRAFCSLCNKLNEPLHTTKIGYYSRLDKWWNKCTESRIQF